MTRGWMGSALGSRPVDVRCARTSAAWPTPNGIPRYMQVDSSCIGVSLYSPMLNELVKPKLHLTDGLKALSPDSAYMAQVPCSWGAAYKPAPWQKFRRWALHQSPDGSYGGELNLALASGWAASWKRYLLELMLVMDWTVLYPFINNEHAAYSTNHLEVGEHIKVADDSNHRREDYEHDLLNVPPPTLHGPITIRLDHLYKIIADTMATAKLERIRLRNLPRTGCQA
jgi:hypothetical protein